MAIVYEDVPMLVAPPYLANPLIGPMAMGYIVELILYGSFSTMFISYCLSGEFKRLPERSSRIILVTLFALITVCSALTLDALWKLAVQQNRTINAIVSGPVESCSLTLLGGLTGALMQSALARRAGAFIENRRVRWAFYSLLSLVIATSVFGSLGATVIGFIWAVEQPDYLNALNWSTVVAIWLWTSATADCIVCGTLAWNLRRRVAGFNPRTDSLLNRLAWYSMRSASYTAFVALGGAIAGSLYRDTVIEWSNLTVAFWAPMPPLYGLAFFSTLLSSRRAIEDTFGPSIAAGPGTATAPTVLPEVRVPREGEKHVAHDVRECTAEPTTALKGEKRRARVFDRLRPISIRDRNTYDIDLERGRGRARARGGGGGGGAGTRTGSASSFPSVLLRTVSRARETSASGAKELRIQVDQFVEQEVESAEDRLDTPLPW